MSESIQTLTLTDFLLARITEDADRVCEDYSNYVAEDWLVERVLGECKARRSLLSEVATWRGTDSLKLCADRVYFHLALSYADHPDYREEWRP